jgi:hypothetical protein
VFVWKALATIGRAGFGFYRLDVEFHGKERNLGRQGKVTGWVVQTGEFMENQRSAVEQLARSRQVLLSVERNLYSLEPYRCRSILSIQWQILRFGSNTLARARSILSTTSSCGAVIARMCQKGNWLS